MRFIGGDMNMGLWGVIPELARRGVELHLCAVHAGWPGPERKWCWDSMGIWAVGPLPNPGMAMSIDSHALTANTSVHPGARLACPRGHATIIRRYSFYGL